MYIKALAVIEAYKREHFCAGMKSYCRYAVLGTVFTDLADKLSSHAAFLGLGQNAETGYICQIARYFFKAHYAYGFTLIKT